VVDRIGFSRFESYPELTQLKRLKSVSPRIPQCFALGRCSSEIPHRVRGTNNSPPTPIIERLRRTVVTGSGLNGRWPWTGLGRTGLGAGADAG
jgi:hypothetical protein